jgi:hypothetical protein
MRISTQADSVSHATIIRSHRVGIGSVRRALGRGELVIVNRRGRGAIFAARASFIDPSWTDVE